MRRGAADSCEEQSAHVPRRLLSGGSKVPLALMRQRSVGKRRARPDTGGKSDTVLRVRVQLDTNADLGFGIMIVILLVAGIWENFRTHFVTGWIDLGGSALAALAYCAMNLHRVPKRK
jgi:hypothetical protein